MLAELDRAAYRGTILAGISGDAGFSQPSVATHGLAGTVRLAHSLTQRRTERSLNSTEDAP